MIPVERHQQIGFMVCRAGRPEIVDTIGETGIRLGK
jgi:hypothetical protein